MPTPAQKLCLAAAVIFVLGLGRMPLPATSPRRRSGLRRAADDGWFLWLGVGTMAVTAVVFLASFALRR